MVHATSSQLGFWQRSRSLLLAQPADGAKGRVMRAHHELEQRHFARRQKRSRLRQPLQRHRSVAKALTGDAIHQHVHLIPTLCGKSGGVTQNKMCLQEASYDQRQA